MGDRPILRFASTTNSNRRKGSPAKRPQPKGPGLHSQGRRFRNIFARLSEAFNSNDPESVLRQDPTGIAPDRALVFVTAGSIQNFARAAKTIGLEVFFEEHLDPVEDFPEGFQPAVQENALDRTLYATMPTLESFRKILSFWKTHQNGGTRPDGAAPWWSVFDLLLELRPWGPEDRLQESARSIIEDRLPFENNTPVVIEFELWPTANVGKRTAWRDETEQRVHEFGGNVLDRSSIVETGFTYEAILVSLSAKVVRTMLDDPHDIGGLVSIQGVQFVLPQMIGQAQPHYAGSKSADRDIEDYFVDESPIRAALFDGTPVAGHRALNGGVVIEDLHDLVRLSVVEQRLHATAMASLILRGDLEADGRALQDTRLVSVPLLVETQNGAWTPGDRLFVDLVHTALTRLLTTRNPIAPSVFVVNFSIGIKDTRFAGRISSLARLMDWWAATQGVLFVISAGNVGDLPLAGTSASSFENSSTIDRRDIVRSSIQALIYDRTLLAPAESLNGITVGALSRDLGHFSPPQLAGVLTLEDGLELQPQVTSAVGPGLHRTIKPDFLNFGGRQEFRVHPNGNRVILTHLDVSQRTGLVVASPESGATMTKKSRGTSPAAALTTRAILESAEALTGDQGAYEGQELPRRQLALLTRALAVNASRWPDDARELYRRELVRLGTRQHARAKGEVCRYFGHGVIDPELMRRSPEHGVTLVAVGSIRKDQAQIFRMPLPPSMSGERVPRSMRVTLSWFTPVNPSRAQYRLASLEAVAADESEGDIDEGWLLGLKADGPDANMIKRGSVWSRRLVARTKSVPDFEGDSEFSILVQCRDSSGGGLSDDDDIDFAIAVTLEVEAGVNYDIFDEVSDILRIRMRGRS